MAMEIGANVGSDAEPLSAGTHDAVLAEVVDLGIEHHPKYGVNHRGILMFQTSETYEDGEFAGKRKEARGYFDADRGLGSVKRKGGTKLRRWLEGWRGKRFTEQDLMKYVPAEKGGQGEKLNLEALVGRPCRVMVEAALNEAGDDIAKLVAVLPPNPDKSKWLQVQDYTPYHERNYDNQPGPTSSGGGKAGGGAEAKDDDDQLPF